MNSVPTTDPFRSRVDRIKELMKSSDDSDKSWQVFYPDEYAVALSETRKAKLDLLKLDLDEPGPDSE